MTDMPTTEPATFLPGGCFPPQKPFNFDPHTGLPIEYDEHGAPYSPIVFITAPELPEGVSSYDPYTGKPLDEHGHPVHGEHNPFGQHTFTTDLEHRGGVDPAGHVIAQRPLYDEHTGLPIHYDEHGTPMVNLIDVVLPPGVSGFDPHTGEPVDENGDVVPGVTNPFRLPEYDTETGLPISYDENGNPLVPNVHVTNPPGVDSYDPITGQPLDEYGEPVEDAVNPNLRPEDRPEPEHETLPNFDPHTGYPVEYDEHGNPYSPIVDIDPGYTQLPEGVAGYDPDTGVPVDEHGNPVEGADNPHGDYTFTTRLEDRDGVDPAGHVIEQRPMYDEESGLPIYYDSHGTPSVFRVDTEKPHGVESYDEKTGEPLDHEGNPVEGAENPYQRPNYDASSGRPVQYDSNGYQVPQPPVYLPPQEGVSSYDPKTGDPLDENGEVVEGTTNPWILDDEDVIFQPNVTSDEDTIPFVAEVDGPGDGEQLDPVPFLSEDTNELEDTDPTTPDGLGEPGDVFGQAEKPVETTDPTDPTTGETKEATGEPGTTGKTTVPEQRSDEDPFAHTEPASGTAGSSTDASTDDDDTSLPDEPASTEAATSEPAETDTSHEAAALDTPDTGADVPDDADAVTAG